MKRRVLFLCTGNSARSVLAEATLRAWAGNRFEVFSAGSQPTGTVNPHALAQLAAEGMSTAGLRSKSWDEFAVPGAPQIDYIFTVCASAAGETCPIWPGHPTTAHWGIDDPAHVEPLEACRAAFERAYASLERRIKGFLALDLAALSPKDVAAAAKMIHEAVNSVEKDAQ